MDLVKSLLISILCHLSVTVSLNICICSSIQRINFHSLHIYLFVISKLQMRKEASYLFLGMPRGNWTSKLQSFIYSNGMTTVLLHTASKLTAGMCSIISLLDRLAFHLKSIFLSVQVFTCVDAEYSRCYAGCQCRGITRIHRSPSRPSHPYGRQPH